MLPALLAIALAASEPLPLPPPALGADPAAAPAAQASTPAPRTIAPAAAQASPPLQLTASSPGPGTFALPALALLALAVAAFLASRRQRSTPRLVKLLETTSLGPKRSLAVAQVGGEILVLGVSEAGIQLLTTRPAELAAAEPQAQPGAAPAEPAAPAPRPLRALSRLETRLDELAGIGLADAAAGEDADEAATRAAQAIRGAGQEPPAGRLRALFGRLTRRDDRIGSVPQPAFESLLAESAEDEELRRKLSIGLSGSVR
jgi:flagellar biogenesis protein FliO